MKRQAERRRDAIRLSLGGNTNQSPSHALTRSPSFRTQWIGRRGRLANLGVSRFIRRSPNRDHYTTIVLHREPGHSKHEPPWFYSAGHQTRASFKTIQNTCV